MQPPPVAPGSPGPTAAAKPKRRDKLSPWQRALLQIGVLDGLQGYKDSAVFALTIDVAVLVNALAVGLELDFSDSREPPPIFQTIRLLVCGLYLWEVFWKLLVDGLLRKNLAWKKRETRALGVCFFSPFRAGGRANLFEIGLGLSAIVETFVGINPWLWRLSVLRTVRWCRIHRLAARWRPLTDLWLVLMGLAQAWKALSWFFLLLLCVMYGMGGAAAGLVDSDGIQHTPGFDSKEYFGSTSRSMLTLLQLATMDGWASSVVRPLMASRPFAAGVLIVFAFVTAYGFLSVGVGVLVWSTVELGKTGEGSVDKASMSTDLDIIAALTNYFKEDLWAANRDETLTKRDFLDAMSVPQLASAFRKLDLPLPDIESLFRHMDHQRSGRITLAQFEKSLTNMKTPATRFDVACLTATLGGSSTSVSRLERRADSALSKLETVKRTLTHSFGELSALAEPDSETGQVPEVMLRRMGKIVNVREPPPPRYTF
jgi:hypothetical protein